MTQPEKPIIIVHKLVTPQALSCGNFSPFSSTNCTSWQEFFKALSLDFSTVQLSSYILDMSHEFLIHPTWESESHVVMVNVILING